LTIQNTHTIFENSNKKHRIIVKANLYIIFNISQVTDYQYFAKKLQKSR